MQLKAEESAAGTCRFKPACRFGPRVRAIQPGYHSWQGGEPTKGVGDPARPSPTGFAMQLRETYSLGFRLF